MTEMIEDGHGNGWEKCLRADCSLQVVRPGKAQCDDERVLTEFGWEWKPPCVWSKSAVVEDIVIRLRKHGRLVAGRTKWDAADEIERLRARVEFVELAKTQATGVYDAAYRKRLAEIEQLRSERDAWQAAATAYEMGLMSTGDFLVKEIRCRNGSVGAAEMVVQEDDNG